MSNSNEQKKQQEAFEIIELATNDLEILTRAFNLISDACQQLSNRAVQLDDPAEEVTLH